MYNLKKKKNLSAIREESRATLENEREKMLGRTYAKLGKILVRGHRKPVIKVLSDEYRYGLFNNSLSLSAHVRVCVYVCVCVPQREAQKGEGDRQKTEITCFSR